MISRRENRLWKGKVISAHLESTHVSWIASILQTILVTLQEEFEKEPGKEKKGGG